MSLFLIAALPFLGALLPGIIVRAGRRSCAIATGLVTLTAFLGLLTHAPAVFRGEVITASLPWLPGLGLNVNLFLDGLGFFFAGLILFIGLLIITYARYYLAREDPMGEFFTYLLLFQGAMVGIVMSNNILMLLVFWELTSLSSFLLIGYWKHLPDGRQGARMALTVTGGGGLAMIAGMLILGEIAGSYDLTVILQNREAIQASPLYLPALVLILAGCFTKSAQFPFHFWLPHAMAAPTPVSAYLHSATMVKAGLFLMARMWPVLSGTPEWFYIVATTGLVTMVVAAVIALFKDDLKALLAFSTVSHLGLITMLLGFGTPAAAVVAVFHILNHATFKCALFMTAGIVDHEAGTRNIRRLGGLMGLMPVTFTLALVTGLSMAGIPPLNGFISKEMMLEEAVHTPWAGNPWLLPALAGIGALFSAAYSFRYVWHTFMGERRDDYPHAPHDPGAGMWLPPAILAVAVVVIGLAPFTAEPLVRVVSVAVVGAAAKPPKVDLYLWHGFGIPLYISVGAIVGAALILLLWRPIDRGWHAVAPVHAKTLFDGTIGALVAGARFVTARLHDGAITRFAAIFTVAATGLAFFAYTGGEISAPTRAVPAPGVVPVASWILLIAACAGMVALHRRRLVALILMGIIGLIISFSFAYLSAPDLALTQISVEVVTVVLLLLALNFLPDRTPVESTWSRRGRDAVIGSAAGIGVGALAWAMMRRDFAIPTISEFHLANAVEGTGGYNVVNVILVDFRGFDTFGEIIVLGIAAVVIFAVTEALLSSSVRARLLAWEPKSPPAGNAHPTMMVVLTRLMLPIVLMVGVYIFLRGHNEPGGGFIAGLIVSIAILMQYMASGFAWTEARQRLPYHGIIGGGVLIAGLSGIGSWFFGYPFLTSDYTYVKVPFVEEFELATALFFDLGVFLTVVGAVLLSLESFSRLARRANQEVSDYAMDIDPLRDDGRETTPRPDTERPLGARAASAAE